MVSLNDDIPSTTKMTLYEMSPLIFMNAATTTTATPSSSQEVLSAVARRQQQQQQQDGNDNQNTPARPRPPLSASRADLIHCILTGVLELFDQDELRAAAAPATTSTTTSFSSTTNREPQ